MELKVHKFFIILFYCTTMLLTLPLALPPGESDGACNSKDKDPY